MLLAFFTLIFLFDFLPDTKERKTKGNIIYCVFFFSSFFILILFSFDIIVPGPTEPIRFIIQCFVKTP
jgi:hypothetical protein